MIRGFQHARRHRPVTSFRGSVLILALWVVFFLAALTLATGSHVAAVLTSAERLSARARARALAEAAASYAAACITANTNQWDGLPGSAWNRDPERFRNVDLDHGRFSLTLVHPTSDGALRLVGLLGEESRVNLNTASYEILTALFENIPVQGAPAPTDLARAILQQRKADDPTLTADQGKDYYSREDKASSGVSGRFNELEDLRFIPGVDTKVLEQMRPYVTVYGSGRININAAPAIVLSAVARASAGAAADAAAAASLAEKIERFRNSGKAFDRAVFGEIRALLNRFEPLTSAEGTLLTAMAGRLDVKSSAFRGVTAGEMTEGGDAGALPDVQVEFVWDAQARAFVYWRER